MLPINLLIIDDQQADREIFSRLIVKSYENVRVDCVPRPPRRLERLIARYDGVIVDENLIDESGLEFCARLHSECWRLPVMMITGLDPNSERFKGARAVVDYIVTKSDSLAYVHAVRQLLRQIGRIQRAAESGQMR